ncbi:endo-1,4-beta-xylanase [Alicyclobacillus shizuokensis]|uniref:endo-1,4-beta-xylanase n=1 Tax=Alicyclobacillus shizuokensis TaxID=392014 RepID=UPI000832A03B|nr:endo-1,4-beta-xylanase [Alicyclobacillus shizuokensis]MCL6624959.1 endo-1,4-beta-xylanase [Alicyclobacillus shizuokensis]
MAEHEPAAAPSLAQAFAGDFRIGAAVSPQALSRHAELIAHHFNSVTAENHMKFSEVHPREDEYTFAEADRLVRFAEQHNLAVRGHTLVWHNQTPDWVFQDGSGQIVSAPELRRRLRDHIEHVVGRWKNQVYAWDVVNEAVADSGGDWLRESPWRSILGDGYIAEAFAIAHEVDPHAQLFYNDYNECHPDKREKIYRLLRWLKDSGVPVHGIGMQGHWGLNSPCLDDIRRTIERFAGLGLRLQVTELDVSLFAWNETDVRWAEPPAERLERQAQRYEAIFGLLREYRNVIDSVTFWGTTDDLSWLNDFPVRGRGNWPLLFASDGRPKPVFWRVLSTAP